MRTLFDHAPSLASAVAGLCLFCVAGPASAADSESCEVPTTSDPNDAANELELCVQQVNDGESSEIVFDGPQSYLLSAPLQIERDVVIRGAGQVLKADSSFSGTSMLEIGPSCPGSNCGTPAKVTVEGFEFFANGEPDIRGIDIRPDSTLILQDAYLHDLSTQTSGGCIRAQAASAVFVEDSRFEDCFATGNGGAVFTEAEEMFLDGARLSRNEASRGGAVYFGATGSFTRKLRLWDANLSDNVADRGGAVYTEDGSHLNTEFDSAVVRDNDATDRGGGLYGGADIFDSTFDGNTSGENGGGALLRTASQVVRSTFRANESWRGGAISVLVVTNEDVDIVGSTFVGNLVGPIRPGIPWGAGVLVSRGTNPPPNSTTFIRNSTFSKNIASGTGIGGGLGVSGASVVADHLTFFDNESSNGRAIYSSRARSSELTLRSSIVANTTSLPLNPVCFLGPTYQTTTSLDTDGSCSVALSNVDPQLAPLASNGGLTQTHLPLAPQVQGAAACFEPFDQRGVARPSSGCDVGAVEQ